jgi:hypothetical protein
VQRDLTGHRCGANREWRSVPTREQPPRAAQHHDGEGNDREAWHHAARERMGENGARRQDGAKRGRAQRTTLPRHGRTLTPKSSRVLGGGAALVIARMVQPNGPQTCSGLVRDRLRLIPARPRQEKLRVPWRREPAQETRSTVPVWLTLTSVDGRAQKCRIVHIAGRTGESDDCEHPQTSPAISHNPLGRGFEPHPPAHAQREPVSRTVRVPEGRPLALVARGWPQASLV